MEPWLPGWPQGALIGTYQVLPGNTNNTWGFCGAVTHVSGGGTLSDVGEWGFCVPCLSVTQGKMTLLVFVTHCKGDFSLAFTDVLSEVSSTSSTAAPSHTQQLYTKERLNRLASVVPTSQHHQPHHLIHSTISSTRPPLHPQQNCTRAA